MVLGRPLHRGWWGIASRARPERRLSPKAERMNRGKGVAWRRRGGRRESGRASRLIHGFKHRLRGAGVVRESGPGRGAGLDSRRPSGTPAGVGCGAGGTGWALSLRGEGNHLLTCRGGRAGRGVLEGRVVPLIPLIQPLASCSPSREKDVLQTVCRCCFCSPTEFRRQLLQSWIVRGGR
jgi:hypothetical protein